MKQNRSFFALSLGTVAVLLGLASGCRSLPVYSQPSGARVMVNGVDSGKVTPCYLKVRNLPGGINVITVDKEGFDSGGKECYIAIKTHTPAIVWSILVPPLGLTVGISSNYRKLAQSPPPLQFNLRPRAAAAPAP